MLPHNFTSISPSVHQEPKGGTCHVPLRGDKWRPEEDAKLLGLLENGTSWKDISEELPGRSESSCANHYHNTLLKKFLEDPKTEEIVRLYTRYDLTHAHNFTSAYIH